MVRPVVEWQTASPLWPLAMEDKESNKRFKQPALLRFSGDDFMEDLAAILKKEPSRLKELVVRHETHEKERAGWLEEAKFLKEPGPKLYQPAHGRFYLVAAALTCRLPGLPDKPVQAANQEKVSFVLRRLGSAAEYGWDTSGKGWQSVSGDEILDEEERLPLFSLNFKCGNRQRRLLAGFIPVASRETYQAGPKLSTVQMSAADLKEMKEDKDPFADPRLVQFEATVAESVIQLKKALDRSPRKITIKEAREVLLFACLDFGEFLKENLPDVWQAVQQGKWTGQSNTPEATFFNTYLNPYFSTGTRWHQALDKTSRQSSGILAGALDESPPTVAAVTDTLNFSQITGAITSLKILDSQGKFSSSLKKSLQDALGTYEKPAGELVPPAIPRLDAGDRYIIRCVYEKPLCKGIDPPLLSEPSPVFQLSSFFDADAPVRPLRITMPANTSIAGLKRFKKGVSILMSNKLRKQINRIKGISMKNLDEGDIPAGQDLNLGMICSFSIPIITICALILLMIIVQLLHIVFWWLPFFKVCFPLKLKKE
jgi:hypothetical protein